MSPGPFSNAPPPDPEPAAQSKAMLPEERLAHHTRLLESMVEHLIIIAAQGIGQSAALCRIVAALESPGAPAWMQAEEAAKQAADAAPPEPEPTGPPRCPKHPERKAVRRGGAWWCSPCRCEIR